MLVPHKQSRAVFWMLCGASAALAAVAPLRAPPADRPWRLIPIVNPGFEETSRPMLPHEVTNGARGATQPVGTWFIDTNSPVSLDHPVAVPGWRTYAVAEPTVRYYAGALAPGRVSGDQPYLTGYSGEQVAISRISPMQQTLAEPLRPNTRYRLTFRAGYGRFDFASGVYVALLGASSPDELVFPGTAGVAHLAQTSGLGIAPPPAGEMRAYTIEYTSPPVLPANLQGRYLAIAMVGSDGIPSMCFDDFRIGCQPAR